ncbi:site-specific tyrosine recombinase XerS [compost metagenome]
MLNGVARRFGLSDIGVHSLRKTWGYHLYNDNPKNLALLMDMFGHEDMTTTLMYLGITQDSMDEAIRRLSFTQSG